MNGFGQSSFAFFHLPRLEISSRQESQHSSISIVIKFPQTVFVLWSKSRVKEVYHLDRVNVLSLEEINVSQVNPHVSHVSCCFSNLQEAIFGFVQLSVLSKDDSQSIGS